MLPQLTLTFLLLTLATAQFCPPGTITTSAGCVKCPKGTFQNKPNKPGCRVCPPNRVSLEEGSTNCTTCPDGLFPTLSKKSCGCGPGAQTFGFGKSLTCEPCKPGMFLFGTSGERLSGCSECSPGTFQPEARQDDCLPCPVGTFSGSGATSCLKCGEGETFVVDTGKCEKCEKGFFADTDDFPACRKCSMNTFKDVVGDSPCRVCPLGTQSARGAANCTECPLGKAIFKDGSCGSCEAGSFFNRRKAECQQCGFQSFTSRKNVLPRCIRCNGSKFALQGATKCTKCPVGTFLRKNGACSPCPPGTEYNSRSLRCSTCGINQFIREGMMSCEQCPPGSYALKGATTCFACPQNEALILQDKGCGSCPPGFSYFSNTAECFPCSYNDFSSVKSVPGIQGCIPCPDGTMANGNATMCVPLMR